MAKAKVITVMCAARLPELLVKRIDAAAKSGGVSRAQFIAEACRMRLDGSQHGYSSASASQGADSANTNKVLVVDGVFSSGNSENESNSEARRGDVQEVPRNESHKHQIDMQTLREICAGKGVTEGAATVAYLDKSAHETPICGKTWWENGEQYECLMDKGHREQKHGLRGAVRRLDA